MPEAVTCSSPFSRIQKSLFTGRASSPGREWDLQFSAIACAADCEPSSEASMQIFDRESSSSPWRALPQRTPPTHNSTRSGPGSPIAADFSPRSEIHSLNPDPSLPALSGARASLRGYRQPTRSPVPFPAVMFDLLSPGDRAIRSSARIVAGHPPTLPLPPLGRMRVRSCPRIGVQPPPVPRTHTD